MSETAQDTIERLQKHREKILPLLQGPTLEITICNSLTESATWAIPKALLSHHSDYSKNIGSGTHHKINLKSFDPKTFQAFAQWMYFDTAPPIYDLGPGTGTGMWNQLRLWDLGNYLDSNLFKDCVLRRFYDTYSMNDTEYGHLSSDLVIWCRHYSSGDAPMRKFLVHTLAQHWLYADYVQEELDDWMAELEKHPRVHGELMRNMAGMRVGEHDVEVAPFETFLED